MDATRTLTLPDARPAERLDTFLSEGLPEVSRSQLKKLIDNGRVTIGGSTVKASLKLKGGEEIIIDLPPPEPAEALPEEIPLDILYEDKDLLVINKPAGMVVHPAAGHARGTLVNALLHHCDDLAGIGGELRPGIVHRIDKDTSGLLVITKNDRSHQHLAAQFKKHSINRRYLALVHGCPDTDSGVIDQAIGRHPVQRKKMSSKARQGKHAVTHWKVIKRYADHNLSLIELRLETGRTHQIRVHFSERNLPLVGDPLYGNSSRTAALKDPQLKKLIARLPGQALHARLLGFIHPESGKYLEFSSEMPDTLADIINYLDQRYQ
ncbi:MAG: RluA family pseudouridine synthase [Desulfuromonas sp.]|nr:MAG: RluA family pseudouridine synthase [Desulfuromonas sp.]